MFQNNHEKFESLVISQIINNFGTKFHMKIKSTKYKLINHKFITKLNE